MTDERRTAAVALPGEPAGWRATLRDLLRYLRGESPDREGVLEWLRETAGETDADAAADQLAFFEAAGLVEVGEEGRVRAGPNGREFLDTHDEGVLYEALADAVGGLETLLESLAVRPLTDVEFRDLLEREFDGDVPPEQVRARRQWLQALGYVECDDGVNDLTRAGRRRVETDDDLTPPRAKASGGGLPGAVSSAATAEVETSGGAETSGEAETQGEPADGAESRSVDSDGVSDPGSRRLPGDEPDDADGFESLKRRYDHTCTVCGDRRQRSPGEGYALVHHPMPTGEPHGGPAAAANAVVVCPNHRADFRQGLLRVDPQTLEIEHAYEAAVSGRTLATADGHDLGGQYLAYHNEVVADF